MSHATASKADKKIEDAVEVQNRENILVSAIEYEDNTKFKTSSTNIFSNIDNINNKYDGYTVDQVYNTFIKSLDNIELSDTDYNTCNEIMLFTLRKAYEEIKYTSEVIARINSRQENNKLNKSITYIPSNTRICEMCEIKYNVNTNRATIACNLHDKLNSDEHSYHYLCNECTLQPLKQGTLKYISHAVDYHAKYVLPHILATLSRRKIQNTHNTQFIQEQHQQQAASTSSAACASTDTKNSPITYEPISEEQFLTYANDNYGCKGYMKGYKGYAPNYKGTFKGGKTNPWVAEQINAEYNGKGYGYPINGKGWTDY